jgi:hypothetical protein
MAVTKYMGIKWTKAIFDIVIAIVLIVFGNKILFGVFPSEAADTATFQLMGGFLWFLVIMCIIAAVRNIILSLRPEPKESMVTLNEKIDALDKKLVTMGLASEAIPEAIPPSPQELKKGRNRKIMVAAGIVAAIVVLAAITMVFLMPKMGGGGSPAGGATPEDTLNALIAAMNSKDANGVLSLTVYSFGNDTEKSQFRQRLNEMFSSAGASFHITMTHPPQIKYPINLSASETNNLTSIQNEIQNRISNTITASCMIVFNMTITTNQSSFYEDGMMPCFQIDGGWYILMDFGGGPDGGGNQSQSSTDAFDSFIDRVKQKDGNGAVGYTIFKFGNNTVRMKAEEGISEMWQNTATFQVAVNSRYEINWTSMTSDQQNNLSGIQSNLSSKFGIYVPVQESCFISYDITITKNGSDTSTMIGFMPCFRTNNSWYVMPEQSDGGQPVIPSVGLVQSSTGTNWTITVTSVDLAGGPPLSTNSVYLTVKYANGTEAVNITLDAMISAGWVNGTRYNDNNMMGQLDTTDMFQLDSSIYFSSSVIILRNFDGTQVYCSQSVV